MSNFHPSIIQIVLTLSILCLLVVYLFFFKSKVINRLVFIVVFAVGLLFVLFPNISSTLAHKVGVGRGTDLVLYLFILAFLIAFAALYARTRQLEQTITQIIRQNAIQTAQKNDAKPE